MKNDQWRPLELKVVKSRHCELKTEVIDGWRYELSKGNAASMERWNLFAYPQEQGAYKDFYGDSAQECFEKAREAGLPVSQVMPEDWHE
jgi:hypothetical protein